MARWWKTQAIPLSVGEELLTAIALLPRMVTYLQLPVSCLVTASAASLKGGAVSYAEALKPEGRRASGR